MTSLRPQCEVTGAEDIKEFSPPWKRSALCFIACDSDLEVLHQLHPFFRDPARDAREHASENRQDSCRRDAGSTVAIFTGRNNLDPRCPRDTGEEAVRPARRRPETASYR